MTSSLFIILANMVRRLPYGTGSMTAMLLFVLPFLYGPGGAASAQELAAISAERPGFSSSPFTLSPSVVQVEGGYQFTHDSAGNGFDDHTLPLMLVRVGLIDNLELQIGWPGHSWTDVGATDIDGANDVSAGVKWQVTRADAAVPVALFAGLSLPVGDDAYSSDEVDPTLGAFWSYSRGLDWFGTILLSESNDDTSVSNAIGISLPVNNEIGSFVEYVGQFGLDGGDEHYLNGGATYLPRNDIQLDVNLGAGLNSRAADFIFGLGFAYRF